jgi:hypothetical protein
MNATTERRAQLKSNAKPPARKPDRPHAEPPPPDRRYTDWAAAYVADLRRGQLGQRLR